MVIVPEAGDRSGKQNPAYGLLRHTFFSTRFPSLNRWFSRVHIARNPVLERGAVPDFLLRRPGTCS